MAGRISNNIVRDGLVFFVDAVNVDYGKLNMYSHKLYNRALSATEILQNYNATKTRYL